MAETPTIDRDAKVMIPRASARLRVESLMYLDLGSENGGFPINISEDGMAFQGVQPLEKDQELCITFKLDGVDEAVTALAKVVWLTESRKAGALQFVDLTETARGQIRSWIDLQKRAESPQHSAELKITPFKAKMAPIAPGVPALPRTRVTAPPASPKAAAPPAPVLPAAAPTPSPAAPPLFPPREVAQDPPVVDAVCIDSDLEIKATKTLQASGAEEAKNIRVAKKSLPVQAAAPAALAKTERSITIAAPPRKMKSGWSMSSSIGLAACLGIAVAGGAFLWPHRAALLGRFQGNMRAKAVAPSVPAVPLRAAEPPAAEAPSDLPMKDPSQWSPIASGLQAVATPFARDISVSAPVNLGKVSAAPAPPLNHGRASSSPVSSAKALPLRTSAVTPAASAPQTASAATLVPVSQSLNEQPAATPLPEAKAPVSPLATGSVEIISDAYPSIRMTTGSQGPASKLGTSLQIGRLASKVDPVYPQEALRQKVAGAVKVHVVIGKTGAVQSAELVDGPAPLAEAAVRAVEQWHYDPTMLGGTPIEVEEGVTLVFRIANPASPAN